METHNEMTDKTRERQIYRVTIWGGVVNVVLLVFKFVAGIVGGSAAMIADAVHSLSDFLTDIVVLLFVKLSNKPSDKDHDYGHGKYETLATALIGLALMGVGLMICYSGATKIWAALQGQTLPTPGWIALVAALLSIVLKEWAYRFTVKVGRRVDSQAVVANAWHHRSDAFSSIGTALGIGGAILLGSKWTVLDPIAAVAVSFFIVRAAYKLIGQATAELLEASLPAQLEDSILSIVTAEPLVSDPHNLRTRRIGNRIAIDLHFRMPGSISLYDAHTHATNIEQRLRQKFGHDAIITLHFEPLKVNGKYEEPGEKPSPLR